MTPRWLKRPPLSLLEQDFRYKAQVVEVQVLRGLTQNTLRKRHKGMNGRYKKETQ